MTTTEENATEVETVIRFLNSKDKYKLTASFRTWYDGKQTKEHLCKYFIPKIVASLQMVIE